MIKPRLLDFDCEIESTDEAFSGQVDVYGRPLGKIKMGQVSKYRFVCQNPKGCTCINSPHNMEIHDWEANELYRNVIKKDKNPDIIKFKMKNQLFTHMLGRDLFLLMGTHHRWKVWMIVSILYPKKP